MGNSSSGDTVGSAPNGSPEDRSAEAIRNLHKPLEKEAGSDSAFVSGDYDYWHYLLDGFDDRGWGCAYRSMQTLVSWFILNGWSLKNGKRMVSVLEAQSILVAIDGKDERSVSLLQLSLAAC
jgi:hypothetical protein